MPAPTWCSECGLVRKMIWRNERSLYWNNCSLCHKKILSMYGGDSEFPVYCHNCWISDGWDPLIYGVEYNFDIVVCPYTLTLMPPIA